AGGAEVAEGGNGEGVHVGCLQQSRGRCCSRVFDMSVAPHFPASRVQKAKRVKNRVAKNIQFRDGAACLINSRMTV
ncbi:hypothetical protein N9P82_01390, partial [bacterium]|nr:hypothetical protein [bacterium]